VRRKLIFPETEEEEKVNGTMFPKWNIFDKDIKDMEKVIKIPEIIFD
jgi:hypothetical protein